MADSQAGYGANIKKRLTCSWFWSHREDKLLIELIKKHGPGNWRRISSHISGRSAMSCRLRWLNHLNPEVDKSPLSKEERERLLQLHKEHGNKWSTIVNYFPRRTDHQIKNEYHVMMAKLKAPSYANIISHGATSQACAVGQSQEGVNVNDYQFIDFMGVGNSE